MNANRLVSLLLLLGTALLHAQQPRLYALSASASQPSVQLSVQLNPLNGTVIPMDTLREVRDITASSSTFDQQLGGYLFLAQVGTGQTTEKRLHKLDASQGSIRSLPVLPKQPIYAPQIDHASLANARFATPTSIDDLPGTAIRLGPNPTQGELSLRWAAGQTRLEARVRVFDLRGQIIDAYAWPAGSEELPMYLVGHPSGQYIVEVQTPADRWQRSIQLQAS